MFWLFDGLLQLQPYMFVKGSNGFLGQVAQNTMGPPTPLTDFLRVVIAFMVHHQIASTIGIAAVQIGIGLGLLWPSTVRLSLAVSAVWAIGVWLVGEGVGQLIFPQASMLSGAPGAAIVYAILGIVLWPRSKPWLNADTSDPLQRWWQSGSGARVLWAVLWCGTAMLELEAANWAPGAISAQLRAVGSSQPGWLAAFDKTLAHIAAGRGTEIALGLLIVEFLVGWGILRPLTRNFALALGIFVSLIFWATGQGFGNLFTGTGTDPNLGPAMVLFAIAIWKWPEHSFDHKSTGGSIPVKASDELKAERL